MMISKKQRQFVEPAAEHIAAPIQAAIIRLAEAYDYARDSQCNLWDFAVEIHALTAIGLTTDQLRWLVANGYVRHGQEVTRQSDSARNFLPAGDLQFTEKTCFVITEAGLRMTTIVPLGSKLKQAA